MSATTVSDPDPVGSALVRFGTKAVIAYIYSLPADDPDRMAYEAAMTELGAALDALTPEQRERLRRIRGGGEA